VTTAGAPPESLRAAAPRARRLLRRLLLCGAGGLIALVAGLWFALGHDPQDPAYDGPAPIPTDVLGRFQYPERQRSPHELSEFRPDSGSGWTSRWVHVAVTTPGESTPHRVQIVHVQPDPPPATPAPAVVVTPILGGRRELATLIARSLARRGLHAAIVPKAESYFDSSAPSARLERVLRTAIVDRRRAIDWLQGLPNVDPDRVGAIGVSLGGLATVLLSAVEPRVRASVVMMAGGDLGDIVTRSDEPRLRRYVREMGLPVDELRQRIRASVVSDPLALAPFVDASRVLLFQTRFDTTVPADRQEQLWQALGRPQRYLLPTGHYSAAVYLPFALPAALDFLETRLGS
jgi:dienelactone hydrolase